MAYTINIHAKTRKGEAEARTRARRNQRVQTTGKGFFDANCSLGAPMNEMVCHADTVADLYAEMDRNGVDKALVAYLNAQSAGPVFANHTLAKMLADDVEGRLFGVWQILPEDCDELPHGEAFFKAMKERRIVAATHLAGPCRWVPCRLTIGGVMDGLRERRIPLLTSPTNYADGWTGLYRFIEEFPENIYILIPGGLWGTDRVIRPLLANYPNTYLETSTFWQPEGLRDIARKYGADRIVYGSGFPKFNQGAMMTVVHNLELDEAERRLIASGNLERIISEEQL